MNLRRVVLAAPALLIMLLAIPASAGALAPPADSRASKSADGTYMDETQNATVKPGKTKLFFWRVDSSQPNDQSVTFDDAATGDSDEGYKIKWYKGKKPRKSKRISHDVKTAGFDFTLRGNASKYFSAKVTNRGSGGIMCLGGQSTSNTFAYSDGAYFSVNGLCT